MASKIKCPECSECIDHKKWFALSKSTLQGGRLGCSCYQCQAPLPMTKILEIGMRDIVAFDRLCSEYSKDVNENVKAVISKVLELDSKSRECTTTSKGKTKTKKQCVTGAGTGFGGTNSLQNDKMIVKSYENSEKQSQSFQVQLRTQIQTLEETLSPLITLGYIKRNKTHTLGLGFVLSKLRTFIVSQMHCGESKVFSLLLLLTRNPYIMYSSLIRPTRFEAGGKVVSTTKNTRFSWLLGNGKIEKDSMTESVKDSMAESVKDFKSLLELVLSERSTDAKTILDNIKNSVEVCPFLDNEYRKAIQDVHFASTHKRKARELLVRNASSASTSGDKEEIYRRAMKPLQFKSVELLDVVKAKLDSHCFLKANDPAIEAPSLNNSKEFLKAAQKDIISLQRSLPLEWGSSVFVRVDAERPQYLSFLIIGPKGTPYENGCFIFDCYLPPKYPQEPPKVLLRTTGGGTFRFNPNLYNTGKVCLSLLGTWSGPAWIPNVSSLLQVILSIQALILVPEPYYNEPGYSKGRWREAQSREYNKRVTGGTIRLAILDMLKNPPYLFRDVIETHFKLKNEDVQTWIGTRRLPSNDLSCSKAALEYLKNSHKSPMRACVVVDSEPVIVVDNEGKQVASNGGGCDEVVIVD